MRKTPSPDGNNREKPRAVGNTVYQQFWLPGGARDLWLPDIMPGMICLTREVRFAVNRPTVVNSLAAANRPADEQLLGTPSNSHGGFPSLRGFGQYLSLQVTLAGRLDERSSYLINIKNIDAAVRASAIPFISGAILRERDTPERVVVGVFDLMRGQWPGLRLHGLALCLSPFLRYGVFATELPMVRLSQKFEFSATHRLHNPSLGEAENRAVFGKCNNPHGHGHNYEVQVTLCGNADENGILIDVPAFERIVAETVIDRFDHKNLNVELPEFVQLIPSVENIAMVIYRLLKPALQGPRASLSSVTVWETPKTWCEYDGT